LLRVLNGLIHACPTQELDIHVVESIENILGFGDETGLFCVVSLTHSHDEHPLEIYLLDVYIAIGQKSEICMTMRFFCFWISESGSKSLFMLRCACGFAGMGV
jgi:hypothetical protein